MALSVPCAAFVDSGTTRRKEGNVAIVVRNCTCGWTECAHNDETRTIMRGEHPESVPDGSGGFYRRPKWGPMSGTKTRFA